MINMLVVMQPGRTGEMIPHWPLASLQQPLSGVPIESASGQDGSGTTGGSHIVESMGLVLFAPQTGFPPFIAQHGTTQLFIMYIGVGQVSPPQTTGLEG